MEQKVIVLVTSILMVCIFIFLLYMIFKPKKTGNDSNEMDDDSNETDDDSNEMDDDQKEKDDDSNEKDDDSNEKDDDQKETDDDSEELDDDSEELDVTITTSNDTDFEARQMFNNNGLWGAHVYSNIDGNYEGQTTLNNIKGEWIQFSFNKHVKYTVYKITDRTPAKNFPYYKQAPRAWKLLAKKNKSDSVWIEIDSQERREWSQTKIDQQSFTIKKPGEYSVYAIIFTQNNKYSGGGLAITNISFS